MTSRSSPPLPNLSFMRQQLDSSCRTWAPIVMLPERKKELRSIGREVRKRMVLMVPR